MVKNSWKQEFQSNRTLKLLIFVVLPFDASVSFTQSLISLSLMALSPGVSSVNTFVVYLYSDKFKARLK